MAFLTDLDEVLRSRGVKVKTHAGWKTRGYNGWSFVAVQGTLWHHTATHRSRFANDDAPTLEMCINGRPGLPGPLCQIVLGRDGTAHVIAAGWGNHAGTGSYPGIPRNEGNQRLIGVEMESSGLPPYDWTLAQIQAIPILRDALRDGYGHKLDIAHFEWSDGGKIDPAGLPGGMNWLRTAKANSKIVAAAAASKPAPVKEWSDMASEAEVQSAVEKAIKKLVPNIVHDETVAYKAKNDKRDLTSHIRYPAANILSHKITAVDGKPYQWASYVRWDNHRILEALRNTQTIIAQNEALTEAVKALAASKGIDVGPIVEAIESSADKATAKLDEALRSSMEDLEITLSVNPQEEEAK